MDLNLIREQYASKRNIYERIESEGKYILDTKLKDIKINKFESRIKTIDSIIDKMCRKNIESQFTELNDIVGIRVVCLFLSDIPKIGDIIRKNFQVVIEDNKIDGSEIETFGYMSFHFIVSIKGEHSGPRYEGLQGINFEIQIRTMAMDAWANISHYLDYKNDNDIPDELKRDFYALSGLFYVADKHFELFFKSREDKKEQLKEEFKSENQSFDEEINIDSLQEYLLMKFPERKHSDIKTISELVDELYQTGYKFIKEIDEKVNKGWDTFLLYEEECPPNSEPGMKYLDVGVLRVLIDILDENFCQKRGGSDLDYRKYRKMIK